MRAGEEEQRELETELQRALQKTVLFKEKAQRAEADLSERGG